MGYLLKRSGELIRSQAAIFGILAVWAFAPVVGLLVYVSQHGGVLTGADLSDPFDQFQYLAWIRDEGSHILASNLWHVTPTPHDYLQPMWLLSGLLWRAGVSVQLAYLLWKPIALLVMFVGFAAYVRHLLPESRMQQAAALFLGLFYTTPVLAIAGWTGWMSSFHQLQLVLATDDASSVLNLWGTEHTAIAIGLMPVFLIAAERLIDVSGRARTPVGTWTTVGAISGALVSWLHPWQGLTLLVIVGVLFVVRPPRERYRRLLVPVVATVLPLIYGAALSHWDPSWHTFQSESTVTGTAPWWALLASFGPLAAVAAFGVRPLREDREWMLVLWVIACAAVYFVIPEFPPHALAGVMLPLSVLAVRGWRRVPMVRVTAALLGTLGVLALTVPVAVRHAQGVSDSLSNTVQGAYARALLVLSPNQRSALAYLDHAAHPGPVLAPWLLSMSVPGFTGRQVFAGHGDWQPASHVAIAGEFFSSALNDPTGSLRRSIVRQARARFVLAGCDSPSTLASDLAPITQTVRRFGCVTLYELSR